MIRMCAGYGEGIGDGGGHECGGWDYDGGAGAEFAGGCCGGKLSGMVGVAGEDVGHCEGLQVVFCL